MLKHLNVKQTNLATLTALDLDKISNYVEEALLDGTSNLQGVVNSDYVFEETKRVLNIFPNFVINTQEGEFIRDYLKSSSNAALYSAFYDNGYIPSFGGLVIPSGYTLLDYVEFTGALTVDLGVTGKHVGTYKIVYAPTEIAAYNKWIFGNNDWPPFGFTILSNGKYYVSDKNQSYDSGISAILNKKINIELKYTGDKNSYFLAGTQKYTFTGTSYSTPKNITLFSGGTKGRVYSIDLDGEHYFLPCKRISDNAIGFVDCITGDFIQNNNLVCGEVITDSKNIYTSHDIINAVGEFVCKNNLDLTTFKSLTHNVLEAMVKITKLDLEGCSNLTEAIDISDMAAVEEVNLLGTGVTEFTADGNSELEVLKLEAPEKITIKSCSSLEGDFTYGETKYYLPTEYQEVEYIYSDGTTPYQMPVNHYTYDYVGVKLNCKLATSSAQKYIISPTKSSTGSRFYIGGFYNNKLSCERGSVIALSSVPYDTTNFHIYEFNYKNSNDILIDNDLIKANVPQSNEYTYYIILFGSDSTTGVPGYVKSLEITSRKSVTNKYIPCYEKSTLLPGLYDVITNTFFKCGTSYGPTCQTVISKNVYQELPYGLILLDKASTGIGCRYDSNTYILLPADSRRSRVIIEFSIFNDTRDGLQISRDLGMRISVDATDFSFNLNLSSKTAKKIIYPGVKYKIEVTKTGVLFDDEEIAQYTSLTTHQNAIQIGSSYYGVPAYSGRCSIYSIKAYDDNDNIISDIIPVISNDNEVFFYDKFLDKTYSNGSLYLSNYSPLFFPGEKISSDTSLTKNVNNPKYANLPSEYTLVEYIIGSGNTYLNTELPVGGTKGMKCNYIVKFSGNWGCIGNVTRDFQIMFNVGLCYHRAVINNVIYEGSVNGAALTMSNSIIARAPYSNMFETLNIYNFTEMSVNYKNSGKYEIGNGDSIDITDCGLSDNICLFYDPYLRKSTSAVFSNVEFTNGDIVTNRLYPCYRNSDNFPGFYDVDRKLFLQMDNDSICGPNISAQITQPISSSNIQYNDIYINDVTNIDSVESGNLNNMSKLFYKIYTLLS